jgi:TfoX/Sxy family transcriptional regulator of competence genes
MNAQVSIRRMFGGGIIYMFVVTRERRALMNCDTLHLSCQGLGSGSGRCLGDS